MLLVEPRRIRDRAADVVAEERTWPTPSARAWGRGRPPTSGREDGPRSRSPPSTCRSSGCWPAASRRPGRSPPRPRGPTWPPSRRPAGPRWPATASRWSARSASSSPTVTGSCWGRRRRLGRPPRRAAGRPRPRVPRRRRPAPSPAGTSSSSRSNGVASSPDAKVAVLAEADLTGRRRAHRRARPRRRDSQRVLRRPQGRRPRRAPPPRRGPLRRHGQAGHRRGRAGLPAARVPGRPTGSTSRPTRSTPSATTPAARRPALSRLGRQRVGQDQGAGPLRGGRRSPRSWSCSTRRRTHSPGHAFAPDTPWQHEMEDAFPYTLTPDQAQAIVDVKADMESDHPWTAWSAATSGSARPRWPSGPPSRPIQDGKQVGGARAHHAARLPALPDLLRALRPLPGAGRGAVPLPHRRPGPRGRAKGVALGRGRPRHRHPPPAQRGRPLQGPRPARHRRGAALRRQPQGGHQAAGDRRRRADAHRHADPPHAGDVASSASAT